MRSTGVIAAFEWGWDTFVAIGTLGLAVFTAALAYSTRALAGATRDDERAQWRPVVIVGQDNEVGVVLDDDGRNVLIVGVRNVGRGPAFAVQAELRFGKTPAGALRPGSMTVLGAGEHIDLEIVVSEAALRALAERNRPFPPAGVEIEISYYDLGERWHKTYLTATRSRDADGLRVRRVLVNETDRVLLPVHGSRRAIAEEARRQGRLWRRLGRAVRTKLPRHGQK